MPDIIIYKEDNLEAIKKFTPKGQSPKIYFELLQKQIMGVDKKGEYRPFTDMLLFLYVAHRSGLDPMNKQIYPVYRWDSRIGAEKMTIQTGIDGFRLIAQRTGRYGGQDDIKYQVEEIFNPLSGKEVKQLTATCTVYRLNPKTGDRMPIAATARWNEYVQKGREGQPMGLWVGMPYNQLGKCAEALALRKGFPAELSGLYTDTEMEQSINPSITADLPTPGKFDKPAKPENIASEIKEEKPQKKVVKKSVEPVITNSDANRIKSENSGLPFTNGKFDIAAARARIRPNVSLNPGA